MLTNKNNLHRRVIISQHLLPLAYAVKWSELTLMQCCKRSDSDIH